MSELEDPVTTILRLITTRIRIVKDNGDTAKILASETFDRELLLKEYDAQITLAMADVQDQKLDLTGRLRRRVFFLRCTSHSIDKVIPGADEGRMMRKKVTEQIEAIIRENRSLPYQTHYNFVGLGYPSGDPHKAFAAGSASELAPSSSYWSELSALEYQSIWYSDDVRFSKSHSVNGQYAMMLFMFKIGPREQSVKKIVLAFEGYATAPAGNGITIKAWNHSASAWQQVQTGSGSTDEAVTVTITSNCRDFVDSNGYVWLLATSTNPSNGITPAIIYCDFSQLTVQVYGVTYCDVVSYKPVDVVEVKPFLYKTEFLFRGWLFENVS